MSVEKKKHQFLLPPKTSDKKTLVLDLDETLVHSQFMPFSTPSDVVVKIEIEGELHDINVMVRPGVKELLEKMEKLYEIVIFTASVSKYADPLLNIIDKRGYCPHRLFREHCSFINATFVKDLKRLGRDLKNIIIVDNSPLCYSLHPENGLPISNWFEDKSDRELFKIVPILEFLSNVRDVREFIPRFVGYDNQIDYIRAKQIINNSSSRVNTRDNKEEKQKNSNNNNNNNNNNKSKGKEINIQIINNSSRNNNNKNNLFGKQKLVEIAMKNIIASVNRNCAKNIINQNSTKNNNNIINYNQNQNPVKNNNNIIASINQNFMKNNSININNYMMGNKQNSKNKIMLTNKHSKNEEEKNNLKLEIINSSSVKTVSNNNNNNPFSTKKNKNKQTLTETNMKNKQKRKNYSLGGNYIKINPNNFNVDTKSIIIKLDDSTNYNNNYIRTSNNTPKTNKTLNLINHKNHSNHTTRSVKYTKKTNTCIIIPTETNNAINNKMSKSLTKNVLTTKNNNNINKENIIQNKNNKNYKGNNNMYKSIYSNTSSHNGLSIHKKQKMSQDIVSLKYNKNMAQQKYLDEKRKNNTKIEKIEIIRNKNLFLNTGFIQNKKAINKINNININLSNNLTLSHKFNRKDLFLNNSNGFDNSKTIRGPNHMKYNLTNSNILNKNSIINYSPNSKYNKINIDNNSLNHYLKMKNMHKNNSIANNKSSTNNKSNTNISKKEIQKNIKSDIYDVNPINKIKSTRPKSSSTVKIESKIINLKHHNNDHKKNKAKFQNKMQIEFNDILQKNGFPRKNNKFIKNL